ncbi:hypothetical protein OG875_17320 [Streptomyces sp. NBC_01498]|uniref:hypothetical protein n=1 Tax=Streptomyces sp. NBC_01498 TaxID=2975870 RepID=UPI002E7AC980|nr:hypothetical protein [Streptomyces sp. NBC_01498]WTL26201.1 hypothetical protein OG875_17320 [Streptomyces sp. NBC_01498]
MTFRHRVATHRVDGLAHPDNEHDVPVYLLIDCDANELVVFTNPQASGYKASIAHPYGAAVKLPDPVGITLDTDELKNYAT